MKSSIINNDWLVRDGNRLDASYHCSDGLKALNYFPSNNISTRRLEEVCEALYIPSRFKRPYVDDPNFGFPYITGSTMLLAQPKDTDTYLSKTLTPNLSALILRKGMILITCSGIIGRGVVVNGNLEGCIGSPDLLRVIPNTKKISLGYLYAYLTSPIGQSLIQMQTYGSVVDHIEAHQVYDLPVPTIGKDTENKISKLIENAWILREEANKLLDKSLGNIDFLLQKSKDNFSNLYIGESIKVFSLFQKQLSFRLDASNYDPPAIEARRLIAERQDCKTLGSVTKKIFHPFRMNMVFVDKAYGVPFLVGGDIIQYKYLGDKYISPVTFGYNEYILNRGWSLLTRSGTIGRLSYVSDYLDGWAASEHIIRIVPDENEVLPGYLYACLESKYIQMQIRNLVYGSVVDAIRENQLAEVLLPIPSKDIQVPIHEKVEFAHRLKSEANQLENHAQQLLLSELNLAEN